VIEVLQAGPLTTVQDLGRVGLRHLGIAYSGALDALALSVANLAVGNARGAAGLEVSFGPLRVRFKQRLRLALAGADFAAQLDGKPLAPGWSLVVEAGQELLLKGSPQGGRCYVAFSGGIEVPLCLGSRSTDLAAAFGGFQGRALQAGDCLNLGRAPQPWALTETHSFGIKPIQWCAVLPQAADSAAVTIRMLPGLEYWQLDAEQQALFAASDWQLSTQSNRMGYRLQGPALQLPAQQELLSHAVFPGTVQLPPNGQPIVLLADAQTSGGYPRLGSVIAADLWRLAQLKPLGHVRFVPVTQDQAVRALQANERYLQRIEYALALRFAGQAMKESNDAH
jgi:biotin-dependent carboxylase-like uncharacterized protein